MATPSWHLCLASGQEVVGGRERQRCAASEVSISIAFFLGGISRLSGPELPMDGVETDPFWCSGNSPWGLTGLGVWLEQAGWPGASHMSASGLRGPAGSPVTSRLHGGHPGL